MVCFSKKLLLLMFSDKAANLGNPEELSNPNDPANKYHGGVHRVVIVNETENGTLPGGFPFPKPPEGGRPFRVYHHLPLEGRHPFRFHHHLPKPRGGINSFWVYHRLPKHHGGGPVKVYHHYPKRRRNANRH